MQLRRWAIRVSMSAAVAFTLGAADPAAAAFPGANGLIAAGSGLRPADCEPVGASGWVVTMRSDGSGLRRLTNCEGRPRQASVFSPDWSPDGRRLLIASRRAVVVMAGDGSRRRVVTPPAEPGAVIADPSFAPDGRRFAYVDSGTIWLARLDRSGRRRLADGRVPRWSPNGRTIAHLDGSGAVVLANARTGRRIRRLGPARGDETLDWSPDGRRLIFSPQCCGPGWVIARADGRGRFQPLEWSAGAPGDAVFSPDGRRIAVTSSEDRAGRTTHSIWVMNLRGTARRRIHRAAFRSLEEEGVSPQLSWGPRPR
jgi:Tol biopolymer transport system component